MPEKPKKVKLKIEDLNFFYGNTQILNGVSLTAPHHEITTLIGASGSGKSTLLRSINQIYRLYSNQRAEGKILFKNQNILKPDIDLNTLRVKIGMVFQKPTPLPLSIYDNIAFAIKMHHSMSKDQLDIEIKSALKRAALWDEVKDKLHMSAYRLSGGQQQRLCIARAIAIKPEILLFDEPTSALDPAATEKIEKLIVKLKKYLTIVMVTHNLRQAKRISNSVVLLEKGHIVEAANAQTFFNKPKDPRTREYIDRMD